MQDLLLNLWAIFFDGMRVIRKYCLIFENEIGLGLAGFFLIRLEHLSIQKAKSQVVLIDSLDRLSLLLLYYYFL